MPPSYVCSPNNILSAESGPRTASHLESRVNKVWQDFCYIMGHLATKLVLPKHSLQQRTVLTFSFIPGIYLFLFNYSLTIRTHETIACVRMSTQDRTESRKCTSQSTGSRNTGILMAPEASFLARSHTFSGADDQTRSPYYSINNSLLHAGASNLFSTTLHGPELLIFCNIHSLPLHNTIQ